MTNALEALLEESIARGIAQGIEQGREQGIEQGREIGMELGRAEGRAEGERALLRRYLVQRFGAISPALDQRIEQADAETVTALFDRALAVERIDQL
jgi:flagellar biosynthesis/type III secretory pathway protein FliH